MSVSRVSASCLDNSEITSPHTVYESPDDVYGCVRPFTVQGTLEVINVVDINSLTQSTTKVVTNVLYR